jgi:hypothetical protein
MCHSVGARKSPSSKLIIAYGDETCNDFDLSENDRPNCMSSAYSR